MKRIICEMCEGTDFIKENNVFVCQNCGTKFSTEEAKKLMKDVSKETTYAESMKEEETLIPEAVIKEDSKEEVTASSVAEDKIIEKDSANLEVNGEFENALRLAKNSFHFGKYSDAYDYYAKADLIRELDNPHDILRYGLADIGKKNVDKSNINSCKNKCEKALTIAEKTSAEEKEEFALESVDDIIAMYKYNSERKLDFISNSHTYTISQEQMEENHRIIYSFFASLISEIINLPSDENVKFELCIRFSYQEFDVEGIKTNDLLEKAADLYPDVVISKEELSELANTNNHINSYRINQISARSLKLLIDMGAEVNGTFVEFGKTNTALTVLVPYKTSFAPFNQDKLEKVKMLVENGADIDKSARCAHYYDGRSISLITNETQEDVKRYLISIKPSLAHNITNLSAMNSASTGCYIATAVYGSYDCPQVWTLRRYRDYRLASKWYGRAFIKIYYTISPTLVKWFGKSDWFKKMWRGKLDRMVDNLQGEGFESTYYKDKEW